MANADGVALDVRVKTVALEVLDAAQEFRDSVLQHPDAAYTAHGVLKLEDCTGKLLDIVKVTAAAELIDDVNITDAAQDVVDAAQHFRDLAFGVLVVAETVLQDAVDRIRVARNKVLHVVKVRAAQTAAQEVLAAATKFEVLAQNPAVAFTAQAVKELEAATNEVLRVVKVPAATEAIDVVTVSTAAQGVVDAAQKLQTDVTNFTSGSPVLGEREFQADVEKVRAATNKVLHVVKVRTAANAVLDAAQEFRGLAIQDPVVEVTVQANKVDKLRTATNKVPSSVPLVRGASKVVLEAAEKLRDSAFEDNLVGATVQAKLGEVQKATNKVPAALDEDQPVYAYTDAANLLAINDSPNKLHKTALADWERREKDLFKKVSRRQTRSADLTNQIYNIIGWFAVFQGVVLTAVSQLTQTKTTNGIPLCGKIWFPIVLTGFGAVVTIGGILHKFRGLKSLELTIHKEKQAQIVGIRKKNKLSSKKGP